MNFIVKLKATAGFNFHILISQTSCLLACLFAFFLASLLHSFVLKRVHRFVGMVPGQLVKRLCKGLFLPLFGFMVPAVPVLHAVGIVEVWDAQVVMFFQLNRQFLRVLADEQKCMGQLIGSVRELFIRPMSVP